MSHRLAVRAQLAERFIFNFRMPPHVLRRSLPAPWLVPQAVHGGECIASFCLLDLRHITVAPLPCLSGLHGINCAPRFAVVDTSGQTPRPAVFVGGRFTSSALGAWLTGLGFSCRHAYARAEIAHDGDKTRLGVHRTGHPFQFCATVAPAGETRSAVFPTADAFGAFIAQGVTSYGPSRDERRLTCVDLHKDDFGYQPLTVLSLHSPLVAQWQRHGAILDSAFRTAGGRCEWTYRGLRAA